MIGLITSWAGNVIVDAFNFIMDDRLPESIVRSAKGVSWKFMIQLREIWFWIILSRIWSRHYINSYSSAQARALNSKWQPLISLNLWPIPKPAPVFSAGSNIDLTLYSFLQIGLFYSWEPWVFWKRVHLLRRRVIYLAEGRIRSIIFLLFIGFLK